MSNPGIIGLRGTGEFTTDFRPTNYRELFTLLEPNGTAPLNALLSMTNGEETDDPKFNHFRDEMPDRVFTINNGGGYNTSTGTLQVTANDDVSLVVPGAVIVNVNTGEVMRATANGDSSLWQLTVTRNVGSTSLSISNGDRLIIAGFAAQEGGSAPNSVSFESTTDYNYTQIFRTAFELSNTLAETHLRTGGKEDEMMTKALKLHMSDIERTMFFGRRAEVNGSTSQPTRYTGGLLNMIANTTDLSTATTPNTLTEDGFDRLLIESIFAYGNKQKLAFVGAKVAGHLMKFGKDRWNPTTMDQGTYGVAFTRYATFAGDLMVHLHPQFRQIPLMDNAMVILDLPHIKYRYMKNRDTKLRQNIQAVDADAKKHEYLTECGLEMTQSKPHWVIRNWSAIA